MVYSGYRIAACLLSLGVMAATTVAASAQDKNNPAAPPAASKSAPPPPAASKGAPPPAAVKSAPPPPAVRQAPPAPIVKQAPAGPVFRQAPKFSNPPSSPAFVAPQKITPGVTPTAPSGVAPNKFAVPRQDRQEFRRGGDNPAFRSGNPQSGGVNSKLGGVNPQFGTGNQLGGNRALRNRTFANPSASGAIGAKSSLANSTFRGRFAGVNNFNLRHRHNRGRVLGWFGPLFWPYAYNDVFDYAFYPYAYDTFWPYAYDDLYGGIFGPFAYGPDDRNAPGYQPGPGYDPGNAPRRELAVCSDDAASLTNWPMERIAATVEPNARQMSALDQLTRATGRAVDILRSACPSQLSSTPTGRMANLQSRLEVMLRAVNTIAPALNAFYQSLDDEQRARFDAMGQQSDAELANEERRDLTQVCSDRGAGVSIPIENIAQAVRPDDRQRAALDNLANASARAADMLRSNCPKDVALTPTGRVDAMRQRLTAMLDAVIMVRPALEAFYNTLNYEQRARFNVIGAKEG